MVTLLSVNYSRHSDDIKDTEAEISGWIDDGKNYKEFRYDVDKLVPIDGIKFTQSFPKKDYKDYEHFQGVIGKFDPYVAFYVPPVEVPSIEPKGLGMYIGIYEDI